MVAWHNEADWAALRVYAWGVDRVCMPGTAAEDMDILSGGFSVEGRMAGSREVRALGGHSSRAADREVVAGVGLAFARGDVVVEGAAGLGVVVVQHLEDDRRRGLALRDLRLHGDHCHQGRCALDRRPG
jgi:hypothetical protein